MNWLLIGASNIASVWMVDAIRAVGDQIVAVQSGSAEHGAEFARRHGIAKSITRLEDALDLPIQAVYISSTNERHEAQTLFCAAQGWHVLCEKPLATQLQAAERMVQACAQAGVTLATNHHLRHNAAHRLMRELIAEGQIGTPVAARVAHSVCLPPHLRGWRLSDPQAGGGVVLDIAVHNADSLSFVLGRHPQSVVAIVSNSGLATGLEDNAMSIWDYGDGFTASTHQGFNTPAAPTYLEVLGTEGSLQGRGILTQAPGGELWLTRADGRSESLPLDTVNLYERGLQEFHRAIAGQPNHVASGTQGLQTLRVALAILQSAKSGQRVAVD